MLELDRIYNMDCIEGMKQIPSHSIDLILCDLPYGVTSRNVWDVVISFDLLWKQYIRIMEKNSNLVFTSRQPFTTMLIDSNKKLFKYTMVWKKNMKTGNLNARKRPMVGFEDIVVFYNGSSTYNPQKIIRTNQIKSGNKFNSKTSNYGIQKDKYIDRQSNLLMPNDVIEINCVHNTNKLHPTQKPLELFEYLVKTYSNEGDNVLDNCMGSGTTAVACKRLNRHFLGFEIDKKYYNISLKRLLNIPKRLDIWLETIN